MPTESNNLPEQVQTQFQMKIREHLDLKGWNAAEKLIQIFEKLGADQDKITTGKGDKMRYVDDLDVLEIQRKIVVDVEKLAQKEEEINIKKVEAMKGLGPGGPTLLYATSMEEVKLPDGRTVVKPVQVIEIANRANDK